MDPTEAFNAMMDDFALGMVDDATEHANNLAEWLNKGGFPPVLRISTDGLKVFTVSDQLAREVCRAACRLVLDQPEAGCNPEP
ncbi:hypothetical protein [Novipirellula sp.]|uniref:hypothetical protein n=1 Tax=Novipirellula sp. TaxID=2795430 RepID=UPI003566A193